MTSGYVPNDLGKLCRLAVLQALSNVENINKNNKKVSVSDNMNNIIKDLTNLRINENNEIENVSENNKGNNNIRQVFTLFLKYFFLF